MNCLKSSEIQEYIDGFHGEADHSKVMKHLENCSYCSTVYYEMLDDVKSIRTFLDTLAIEPQIIPSIDTFKPTRYKQIKQSLVLKVAAAFLFILFTVFMLIPREEAKNVTENEWVVNNMLNASDPNQQIHEHQMLITITNSDDEIVHYLLLSNND